MSRRCGWCGRCGGLGGRRRSEGEAVKMGVLLVRFGEINAQRTTVERRAVEIASS